MVIEIRSLASGESEGCGELAGKGHRELPMVMEMFFVFFGGGGLHRCVQSKLIEWMALLHTNYILT